MRARLSIFFAWMGILLMFLSVAAFLANSREWLLLGLLALLAFGLSAWLGRGQFQPKPSDRFSGIRKLSQHLKERQAAKKEKK